MTEKEKLEKLKKLTDAMYYAAQHLTTDASRLHKAMDDYHRFIVYEYGIKSKNATGKLKEYIDKCKGCNNVKGCITCVDGSEWAHYEEPVSENLEGASKEYADKNYAEWLDFVSGDERDDHYPISEAFKAGAKWQKEQMLAKAVDGDITFDYYGDDDKTYGCIAHDSFCLEDLGLKDTDKVKMVLIKEEVDYE